MKSSVSIVELKRATPTELRKELMTRRGQLAKMRIGISMRSEKNHAAYRALRRDIARIEMVRMAMQGSQKAVPAAPVVTEKVEKSDKKASQPKRKSVQRSSSKS